MVKWQHEVAGFVQGANTRKRKGLMVAPSLCFACLHEKSLQFKSTFPQFIPPRPNSFLQKPN
ncbi:MAG TPA: hypothetical protein VFZ42_03275, partial [Chitinophagaceae bacterium]